MERFKVIDGNSTDEKEKPGSEKLVCRRCNGSHFLKTKLSPMIKDGRTITGGTDALICVHCLANGQVVQIV